MKISEQLRGLEKVCQAWATGHGGGARLAANAARAADYLAQKPGAARVALLFLGEGKAGEHEEAGLVTRRWAAVVSRGRTLEEEGKEAQTLYDLAEELRDELRAIEWADDGTLEWTDYEGLEVAESEGLAAWQVRFSTGHKL